MIVFTYALLALLDPLLVCGISYCQPISGPAHILARTIPACSQIIDELRLTITFYHGFITSIRIGAPELRPLLDPLADMAPLPALEDAVGLHHLNNYLVRPDRTLEEHRMRWRFLGCFVTNWTSLKVSLNLSSSSRICLNLLNHFLQGGPYSLWVWMNGALNFFFLFPSLTFQKRFALLT